MILIIKNYFDLDKVPFSNSTTQPYNNGLKAQKTSLNRGNKIPITLPIGKTIYATLDVVDSQINGTAKYITMGFYNSGDTRIDSKQISSTIAHKSFSFTLSEEVSYIQFYFQADNDKNAVGDYITMDNIMLRTEGENKSILCKGDFRPAALFKGDKKIAGYTTMEFSGDSSVVLENCYNDNVQNITVRGKNYFDLDKVPFSNSTTQPYNNGLKAQKASDSNRGNRIPITLPIGKTIYATLDVVDSQINGTAKYITMGFYNSSDTLIERLHVESTIAHKSYPFTLSEEVSYIQFYFQSDNDKNAVGDYITMDNIMLRTEGDDTYEPYIEPRITVRGKNYFDKNKIPFNQSTTQPYNNGLKAQKTSLNRGNRIPITLPIGKTIYATLDVVDSQINGTLKYITMGFYNSSDTRIDSKQISSTIAHKSFSFTLSEEVSYMQFYFQSNDDSNANGDYVTMDNIMIRTEGNDTFELYIEPQTITFENGEPMADIPTYRGTTVLELESDITATISGKYKKQEG